MSMQLLRMWWSMVSADADLNGNILRDGDVVLSFSGSGASCCLTKKQLDDALAEGVASYSELSSMANMRVLLADAAFCIEPGTGNFVSSEERQSIIAKLIAAADKLGGNALTTEE